MRAGIILILFFIVSFAKSQGFTRSYFIPHSKSSYCTDVFEAPNGHIILTGTITDTLSNPAASKLCIVGTDAHGNFLWQKAYGRSTFHYLRTFASRSVVKDNSNFYLYTAATDSNNKYFSALIKFNYNGDTLWQKKYYDATQHLYVQGLTKSVDNGFLMTGFFEGGNESCLLIKTDAQGNELWRKKLLKTSGINVQAGYQIIQDTATKKIVIAGHQYDADGTQPGGFSPYANIIVTDSLGNLLAKKVFSGACGSYFKDLIQTWDKKCVAVGAMYQCDNLGQFPNGGRENRGYAVKFDLNNLNNVIWQKQFDTLSAENVVVSICELENMDLVLAGGNDTVGNKFMSRISKIDKNGNLKWRKYLSRDDIYENAKSATSINKTSDKGFVLANQYPYLLTVKPLSFIKIDSTGCDSTLAYCKMMAEVGINELTIRNGEAQVFPNPVKSFLTIKIERVAGKDKIEARFMDIYGREVKRTTVEETNKIDVSDLSCGIYLVTVLKSDREVYKAKIIKE